MAKRKLAWWLAYGDSRDACVVETDPDADVLAAVALACRRGCCGIGGVDATFSPASDLAREIPRRLWFRLRTVAEWRSLGVEPAEPCPLCVAEGRERGQVH